MNEGSTYWGYDDRYLIALGKVVVAMARCEGFAAILASLIDPIDSAPYLLASPSRLDRRLLAIAAEDPEVAQLASKLKAVRLKRNRLTHDIPGVKQKREEGMAQAVIVTGEHAKLTIQAPSPVGDIEGLSVEIDGLSSAFGTTLNDRFGNQAFQFPGDGVPLFLIQKRATE